MYVHTQRCELSKTGGINSSRIGGITTIYFLYYVINILLHLILPISSHTAPTNSKSLVKDILRCWDCAEQCRINMLKAFIIFKSNKWWRDYWNGETHCQNTYWKYLQLFYWNSSKLNRQLVTSFPNHLLLCLMMSKQIII